MGTRSIVNKRENLSFSGIGEVLNNYLEINPQTQHRLISDYIIKFGDTGVVRPGDAPKDIWRGAGIYRGQDITTPEKHLIASNRVADTLTGTGAQRIRIFGLKTPQSEMEEFEEIDLNGTTPVTTQFAWYRIYRAKVIQVGSDLSNQGVITATSVDNAFVSFSLPGGNNRTQLCAYTIPYNRTGLVYSTALSLIRTNGSAGSARVRIQARNTLTDNVWDTLDTAGVTTGNRGDKNYNKAPFFLPAGSDVKINVFAISDNNSQLYGDLSILILK